MSDSSPPKTSEFQKRVAQFSPVHLGKFRLPEWKKIHADLFLFRCSRCHRLAMSWLCWQMQHGIVKHLHCWHCGQRPQAITTPAPYEALGYPKPPSKEECELVAVMIERMGQKGCPRAAGLRP